MSPPCFRVLWPAAGSGGGTEYVEDDDGTYVPVVDTYRYISTTGS